MAYLVLHHLQHGRIVSPPGQAPVREEVRVYQPGELFEPVKGEDISHLLESGVLVKDDEQGRARARAIAETRESVKRPYGLL